MIALNSTLLKKFLKQAADTLDGEWLLVGGTLLPAVGLDVRPTVDIDLIGLGEKESAQNLELMEIAEKLGLAVESVNQAAAFFLKKVGYKKSDLLELQKGRRATIYRPSVMLYWKLKLPRLSDADQLDCQHYFNFCLAQKDHINKTLLLKIVEDHQAQRPSSDKMRRLLLLKSLL